MYTLHNLYIRLMSAFFMIFFKMSTYNFQVQLASFRLKTSKLNFLPLLLHTIHILGTLYINK